MANPRIRLSPQTINAVTELGQKCGIDDSDTLIKLLIRKYGDQLAELLAPSDLSRVTLSQSVPRSAVSEAASTPSEAVQASTPLKVATNGTLKPRPPITGF
jgi:hypothetical protein